MVVRHSPAAFVWAFTSLFKLHTSVQPSFPLLIVILVFIMSFFYQCLITGLFLSYLRAYQRRLRLLRILPRFYTTLFGRKRLDPLQ